MKKLTLLLTFLIVALFGMAQRAEFGKITGSGNFDSYLSKTGDVIHVGDTLTIGKPTGEFSFVFITQNQERIVNSMMGKSVAISQIKSYGGKKWGLKVWILFKGFGLLPVVIDYENALEVGEIINPKAKLTRQMAINKLKEAKELLDLQMMSQEAYDKLKAELSPIIIQ